MSLLPDRETIDAMSLPAELTALLHQLDCTARQVEALSALVLDRAEATGAHLIDDHNQVGTWARAECNWSNSHSRRAVRLMRTLRTLPNLTDGMLSGAIGVDQADSIARLHSNPRTRGLLAESAPFLLEDAVRLVHQEFEDACRSWERVADADGAHASHEKAWGDRDARIDQVGTEAVIAGHGDALSGSILAEILERFTQSEWHHDLDQALADHGDTASISDMGRTNKQRRFDALCAIFLAAAASGKIGAIDTLGSVVFDDRTFRQGLDAITGANRVAPIVNPAPDEYRTRRCHTATGVHIDPQAAVEAALLGRLRRVLCNSAKIVTELGRATRCFVGGARDAVTLLEQRCTFPGCNVPVHRTQADHTHPYSAGGTTDPTNGGPLCGRHNRHKNRGYTTWRDPNGHWHHYRPDGTEICPHTPVDPQPQPPGSTPPADRSTRPSHGPLRTRGTVHPPGRRTRVFPNAPLG